jgi:hypothetical protein
LLFQVETAMVGAQGDAKRLRHRVRGYQTRDCQDSTSEADIW